MNPDNPNPSQPAPQTPAPVEENSSKLVIWLIGGLVVIILLVGGIYLFLARQTSQTPNTQPIVQTAPKAENTFSSLEQDLNAVNAEANIEADFAPVDQDLQSL